MSSSDKQNAIEYTLDTFKEYQQLMQQLRHYQIRHRTLLTDQKFARLADASETKEVDEISLFVTKEYLSDQTIQKIMDICCYFKELLPTLKEKIKNEIRDDKYQSIALTISAEMSKKQIVGT